VLYSTWLLRGHHKFVVLMHLSKFVVSMVLSKFVVLMHLSKGSAEFLDADVLRKV
jgi:hypothetical protein